MLGPADFFYCRDYAHAELLEQVEKVWELVARIGPWLEEKAPPGRAIAGTVAEGAWLLGEGIHIGEGSVVEPGALIQGPAWLGRECRVLHGAYIRGNLVAGDRCVIGHASEVKNSLFLDDAHAPHFAYVGDSVLGNRVNLGAGTKLSNLVVSSVKDPRTGRRPTLRIGVGEELHDTGLAKLGAIMGDDSQTGCNAVCNPGTLVGRRTLIYPNASVKGYIGPDRVVKLRQNQQQGRRRV